MDLDEAPFDFKIEDVIEHIVRSDEVRPSPGVRLQLAISSTSCKRLFALPPSPRSLALFR